MTAEGKDSDFVLSPKLGGGPHGVGDPDDKSLRRAEKEILIPQKMKAKAKKEMCAGEVRAFGQCAKEKGLLMPFQCRGLAKELHECLNEAYKNQPFIDKCTEEYIKERTEFRRTGIKTKEKKKDIIL